MRKMRKPDGFSLTAVGVFVLLIAAFMAIPIFTLVKASFSMPQTGGFTLSNYAEVFTKKLYQMSFVNSVGLSGGKQTLKHTERRKAHETVH